MSSESTVQVHSGIDEAAEAQPSLSGSDRARNFPESCWSASPGRTIRFSETWRGEDIPSSGCPRISERFRTLEHVKGQ